MGYPVTSAPAPGVAWPSTAGYAPAHQPPQYSYHHYGYLRPHYVVTYAEDNYCPVQWVLFLAGCVLTPIVCCVGALLPVCDRRFMSGAERCGWIANLTGSSLTFMLIIAIIAVARYGSISAEQEPRPAYQGRGN